MNRQLAAYEGKKAGATGYFAGRIREARVPDARSFLS